MTLYLSQKKWGRSCLHLAAALHRGHWRWHLAGIRREFAVRIHRTAGPEQIPE
jgi:hypothetical protein